MTDSIVVIGDSHTRVFSYHHAFLPLFIGSGRDNCFLSDIKYKNSRNKIYNILERIKVTSKVMLVFGEPDIRNHFENVFGTKNLGKSDQVIIQEAVERYKHLIEELNNEKKFELIIFNAVPSGNSEYNPLLSHYNQELELFCNNKGIHFIDIWDDIFESSKNVVDHEYQSDPVHLNENIIPIVIKELKDAEILPQSIVAKSKFKWAYRYKFSINDYDIAIWGDKTKLEENFAQTKLINDCMHIVNSVIGVMQKPSILVLNSKEGLIPFSITKTYASSITGVDNEQNKIIKANEIKNIIHAYDLSFFVGDSYSANIRKAYDVVIDLSGECMSVQTENSSFNKLYAMSRSAVIVLCKNRKLSIKLLNNAGFNSVFSICKIINIGPDKQNQTLLLGVKNNSYINNIRWALYASIMSLFSKKIYAKFASKFI
jgi:hypothetical protein